MVRGGAPWPLIDEAAFHDFVVARTPALSRTAYLLTGDHQLSEDLVQTSLFKAAHAWHRIQGDPEPYVRRIIYHENISWWRRRRHLPETAIGVFDAPATADDDDPRILLQQALAALSVKQRTVLVLRYFEDLTEAQTAARARDRARHGEVGHQAGAGPAARHRPTPRRARRGAPMTETLREALHTLGDEARVARVDEHTFGRARVLRRRRLLAMPVAAVLVVLSGALLVPKLALPTPGSPAAGGVAAVPDRIVAVPSHLDGIRPDGSWSRPGETDLAVGRASVAFATPAGRAVLIGAGDGRYHLMDLPGAGPAGRLARMMSDEELWLALSPDGRTLAWAWNAVPPDDGVAPVPSGVRLADLTTGAVRTVRIVGGHGVLVAGLDWSPDGHWLTYSAQEVRSWSSHDLGGQVVRHERLDTRTLERVVVPGMNGQSNQAAVGNSGQVASATGTVRLWDGARTRSIQGDAGGSVVGPMSPRGRVALTSFQPPGWQVDAVTADTRTVYRIGMEAYPYGAYLRVVGWVDEDHPVVVARKALSASTGELGGRLLVLGPRGSVVTASEVDRAYPDALSVAVDLMTLTQPSADFPTPAWPWSPERKIAVYGGGVALAVLALALARGRRRRPTLGE